MILLHMIFSSTTDTQRLYFRGDGIYQQGKMTLSSETCVSFDTYYNAFFYGTYLQYTQVNHVRLCVRTSGEGVLSLCVLAQTGKEYVLETVICNKNNTLVNFQFRQLEQLPVDGALFLRARAVGNGLVLHAGWFETERDVQCCHLVDLAAVICTYHREEYVKRTLARVDREIWSGSACELQSTLDFLIVDNGNTFELEKTYSHVQVFPNKNCGGSGGFARGLLEAMRRHKKYTHVLLMDDDINFEPEILFRTIQFLKCAEERERPLCIGGQMLIEERPTIQHEAGGMCRKGFLHPNKNGLDLSDQAALLQNAKTLPSDYQAWWYCCLPVCVVEKYGLPLPFFIKFDDVEYGLRVRAEIVLMNGIGVWHMGFDKKLSTYLTYYNIRNGLVLSCLHGNGQGMGRSVYRLVRSAGKALLTGEMRELAFALKAFRDFLGGVDFFLETDEESLNSELIHEASLPSRRIWAIIPEVFQLTIRLLFHYKQVCRENQRRAGELTSVEFWRKHLQIEQSVE